MLHDAASPVLKTLALGPEGAILAPGFERVDSKDLTSGKRVKTIELDCLMLDGGTKHTQTVTADVGGTTL